MQNLLSKIEITKEAVKMEVLDLDGLPLTDIEKDKPTINLYGTDSEPFRNALKDCSEKEDKSVKLLAACVKSWTNIKDDDGKAIECNYENAVKLFKRYPIVMSQVDTFIAKRANYLKKF